MSRRALIVICLILFVLLGFSALVNVGLLVSAPFRGLTANRAPGNFRETELYAGDADAKIVHIDLEGMISNFGGNAFLGNSVSETKRMLEAASVDPLVKAIVLRINSPGGEITASDILYDMVKRTAKAKPIVIYMDTVGASGGYYIACGGTHIMANETTITGSIGVIIQTLNYEELLGKVGLDAMVFTSGEFKDTMSPSRPMREDEKVYVQGMVDEMYERFVGLVADARGMTVASLKEGVADGRILTGKKALEAGLIDSTGYIEAAYTKARELSGESNARVVKYARDVSFGSLLGFMGESTATRAHAQTMRLELAHELFPKLQPGAIYLLPEHFAY